MARPSRTELVGTGLLVHDHHVGRGQLGGDRLGGGDNPSSEPAGEEAFGAQGGGGLGDDLPGMPDVGPAGEKGYRPPVPAVQGVAEDEVGPYPAGQRPQAEHADGPAQAIGGPVSAAMARADALHRYYVQCDAGDGELVGHRRGGGHGDMDRPARGDELAGHAEQGLVRSSPFGHRLHAQDSESMAGPRGPAAPTARLAPHYAASGRGPGVVTGRGHRRRR